MFRVISEAVGHAILIPTPYSCNSLAAELRCPAALVGSVECDGTHSAPVGLGPKLWETE